MVIINRFSSVIKILNCSFNDTFLKVNKVDVQDLDKLLQDIMFHYLNILYAYDIL
jgi:hypothetical protein